MLFCLAAATFLGEPVSGLEMRHQLIVMDIARDFARAGGGALAILHDLNLAAMHGDRIHVMHRGTPDMVGIPRDVLSDALIERVFGCKLRVGAVPAGNMPFVLPQPAI